MKHIILILPFLFLACANDEANISALSAGDQSTARIAAHQEGIEITNSIAPWVWVVEYRKLQQGKNAQTHQWNDFVEIYLDPGAEPCEIGGHNRQVLRDLRHEFKHAKANSTNHSDDPDSIMNEYPKCESVEYPPNE